MHIQINALFEACKTKHKLTIHGGRSGLGNAASWVYLAEDITNISFLKGGELIITTGLFTQSGVTLRQFIRTLAACNCSGILLNTGKYIHVEDIAPEIIEFCDKNGLPIFTMPWEIFLVDIMQDLCRMFLQASHKFDSLSAAFQNAIYQTPVPDNILRTINQFGFATQGKYRVIGIRHLHETTTVTSSLNSYNLKYHLFEHDNMQILICDMDQKSLSLEEMTKLLCYYDNITLGISDVAYSLAEIGVYYRHARFSLVAAEYWKRPYVQFDELGLLQLLFSTSEPALLESIYRNYLGKIEKYDEEHNTDYLNTLQIFMLSDCNLLETASRMHTHRNTIVYRIRKIKDLLNSELDNSLIKFNLMMAFYIREYLAMYA